MKGVFFLRIINKVIKVIEKIDDAIFGMLGTLTTFIGTMATMTATWVLFSRIAKADFFAKLGATAVVASKGVEQLSFAFMTTNVASVRAAAGIALTTRATNLFKTAIAGVVAFAKANPWLLIITGVIALVFALNKLRQSLTFSIIKLRESIVAINESVDKTLQSAKAIERYKAVVDSAGTAEEKLVELREKGLDQIPGLIALYDKEGEAILSTVEATEKLLAAQRALQQAQLKENLVETEKSFAKLEKQILSSAAKFDSFVEVQKVMDGVKEITNETVFAVANLSHELGTKFAARVLEIRRLRGANEFETMKIQAEALTVALDRFGVSVSAGLVKSSKDTAKYRVELENLREIMRKIGEGVDFTSPKAKQAFDEMKKRMADLAIRLDNMIKATSKVEPPTIVSFEEIIKLKALREEMEKIVKAGVKVPDLGLFDRVDLDLTKAEERWRNYRKKVVD
ncbi:hypothetical protein LCGC14_2552200, partial [marine sediment metagenome]